MIQPLPLLELGLCVFTAIYLLRGLAVVPVLIVARNKATPFVIWSSGVCLVCGVVHLAGLVQVWPTH